MFSFSANAMNSENNGNHSSMKIFGKFHSKLWPADVMTFFFGLTCFWAENLTSAGIMTLKEPILLLCSENMVTLCLQHTMAAKLHINHHSI